jgi:PncC family amidohydrolase
MTSELDDEAALAERLGALLDERGCSIAVAESLTGGLLVQALARVEGSGEWLLGGVVAYASSVKHELLGVRAEKVVSRRAAEEMASGARGRLGADIAVAVTGVAGPDPQDGEPPGTVWIGVDDGTTSTAELFTTTGDPEEICRRTVAAALRQVTARITAPASGDRA